MNRSWIVALRSRWMPLALLAISAVVYLGTAGQSALVDDDVDAAHALVSREMLARHDYVIMYMDGLRYMIRAPMHIWMVAASYALLGESEFATRLPLALAMVGLTLLSFAFGRRFFGERAGFYGGLATATSLGMYIFTRNMIPEAIYALEFALIFYLFLRSWTGSLEPRAGYWGAAAVCALAVLTRGAIGFLFPAGAIVAFITVTRGWRRWRELRLLSSAAIFLAVAAPWHILAGIRAPGFYWVYFINEHVNRALGTRLPHDYSAIPLWLWWLELFVWLFPWSFFVPLLAREFPAPRTWGRSMTAAAQARLFLFIWAGVILLFFSIERGSRVEYYSFGAWPALAMLLGLGIADAEQTGNVWLGRITRALAVLGLLIAGLGGYFVWISARSTGSGDLSADLQTRDVDSYRSSISHVLDLTPQALADLRIPLLLATISLAAAFLAAWVLRTRKLQLVATAALAVGMMGFLFAANRANRAFEATLSSRALAGEMNKVLLPGDQIALYGDIRVAPSIAFYCHRRVLLWNALGSNLEIGSHYPDAPKTFFSDQDFLPLWKSNARVLLVVPEDKRAEALQRLPENKAWVLAAAGGKTTYVNLPLTAGQAPVAAP